MVLRETIWLSQIIHLRHHRVMMNMMSIFTSSITIWLCCYHWCGKIAAGKILETFTNTHTDSYRVVLMLWRRTSVMEVWRLASWHNQDIQFQQSEDQLWYYLEFLFFSVESLFEAACVSPSGSDLMKACSCVLWKNVPGKLSHCPPPYMKMGFYVASLKCIHTRWLHLLTFPLSAQRLIKALPGKSGVIISLMKWVCSINHNCLHAL